MTFIAPRNTEELGMDDEDLNHESDDPQEIFSAEPLSPAEMAVIDTPDEEVARA